MPAPISVQPGGSSRSTSARRFTRVLLGARGRTGSGRDCETDPARGSRRCAIRRDGGARALAPELCRLDRACLAPCQGAGLVQPRYTAAADSRPRVSRAAGVRIRTTLGLAIRGVSVVRAGAAGDTRRRRHAGPRRRTNRSGVSSHLSPRVTVRVRPSSREARRRASLKRRGCRNPPSRNPESESVLAGTLRAPWRWEALIVDAAVIGQDATRWKRRLEGKHAELERQIGEAKRDDGGDEAAVAGLRQVQQQLAYLKAFALPVIEEMAGWPSTATWGEWLDRFEALAPRVLKTPAHVLRVLADLRPMGEVGPIDLDEARRVLAERLLTIESEPPVYRYGRVFVGTPDQVRGRSFRVVFVPGLAERMFPQKPREDPMMLDGIRQAVDTGLPTQHRRLASERLLLQLAAGAASDRLYVSYPRIELSESRARVPSFYALDIMRAATGRVPHHDELEQRARDAGDATLAWPAPSTPEDAIDDQEHDLAVLRRLLDETTPERVKGHAHYLLKLNECLRRSVVDRWARGQRRWSPNDGLTRVQPYTKDALAAQRLNKRSYSASALQLFSACPYQFVLSSIYRLRPFEQPEPLQRMDPLTRGSLFHEIQASFFRALQSRCGVAGNRRRPSTRLASCSTRSSSRSGCRAHDELVPAVERVWQDELATIRRDLHAWLEYLARDGEDWLPVYFEFAFRSRAGRARRAQPSARCRGGRAVQTARGDRSHRGAPADQRAANHRSQDRTKARSHREGADRRGRRAAAHPLFDGRRSCARAGREPRTVVLLHLDGQLLLAIRFFSTSDRGRPVSKCSRWWIAPSRPGFWRRRRPKRRAADVTSCRSADPMSFAASPGSRRRRWRISPH